LDAPVSQKKNFRFFSLQIFCFQSKKINRAYIFALICFQKFFVSLRFASFVLFSLHFIFVSLQMQKQPKKYFFLFASKRKISLPFCFEAKLMAVFHFRFASFHFEAKMMEVFRYRFTSFHFKAKRSPCFLLLAALKNLFFTSMQPHLGTRQEVHPKGHQFHLGISHNVSTPV
jgi:hypothetical protein